MGQSWDWQLAFPTHLVLVFVLSYPVSSLGFLISKKGSAPCLLLCRVRKPLTTQSVPEPCFSLNKQPALQPCGQKQQLLHLALLHAQQICSLLLCEPDGQRCTGLAPGSLGVADPGPAQWVFSR